eukprot:8841136-Pyramimonas_sp.AAC.1
MPFQRDQEQLKRLQTNSRPAPNAVQKAPKTVPGSPKRTPRGPSIGKSTGCSTTCFCNCAVTFLFIRAPKTSAKIAPI